MKTFTSDGEYFVRGMKVFSVRVKLWVDAPSLGERIQIDGALVDVCGIESYRPCKTDLVPGGVLGIAVTPVPCVPL